MKVGATVIPVNPIYTADEMHYILQNGDVKTIIVLDVLLPVIQSLTTRLPSLENIIICETSSDFNHTETEKNENVYYNDRGWRCNLRRPRTR